MTTDQKIEEDGNKQWHPRIMEALFVGSVVVYVWVFFTILTWAFPLHEPQTLVGVLKDQWQWLVGLSKRIV